MGEVLIITNGPLTRRIINFVQFAPMGLKIKCEPIERKIAGAKIEWGVVDECSTTVSETHKLKGDSDD